MKSFSSKLKELFIFLLIILIFSGGWVAFLDYLQSTFTFLNFSNFQQKQENAIYSTDTVTIILMSVFLVPVLEEFVFRSLIKPNNKSIAIFFSGLVGLILYIFLGATSNIYLLIAILLTAIIITYVLAINRGKKYFNDLVIKAFHKNYIAILTITSIIFGLLHCFNYASLTEINIAVLLLAFPRVVTGFLYGIFKIRNGLKWSIALHIMKNLVVVLIGLF